MKTHELIRGQIYKVSESCGMMVLEGKYLGKFKKGYNFECFVFERVNPLMCSSYNFFGAQWRVSDVSSEKPNLYLYNTHYGGTIKTLKKVHEMYGNEEGLDFDYNE